MNFLSNILHAVLSFLDGGLFDLSAWQVVVYTLVVTHITIAGVTIYLHRHQAHRALELHPIVSHFFRFWLWLTTGQVTKEWAAVHRKHHAKCETVDDPHSPVTHGIKEVLLRGAELYRAETKNQETLDKYGHGCPTDWIENNLYTRYSWLGVSALLPLNVALFGVIGVTIWAVQMLWIPITAAGIINGIGHFWGYRNYDCNDAATNIMPWGILIGGEELHNNHHTFATSAKLSSKWYEFDIGWLYIRTLQALGLAKVKHLAPKPRLVAPRPVVDIDTVQAVIRHHYDVLSSYTRSLKTAYAREFGRLREASPQEARALRGVKRWLGTDERALDASRQAQMLAALGASHALATMYAMRRELTALWARSGATGDQLVRRLQDWCERAEDSGIAPLADFSMRLRSYA